MRPPPPPLLLRLLPLPRRPAVASHGGDRLLLVSVARGCRCCDLAARPAHDVHPLGGRCRRRRGGRHLPSKQGAAQKRSHTVTVRGTYVGRCRSHREMSGRPSHDANMPITKSHVKMNENPCFGVASMTNTGQRTAKSRFPRGQIRSMSTCRPATSMCTPMVARQRTDRPARVWHCMCMWVGGLHACMRVMMVWFGPYG